MNYIELNGVRSTTITGLLIQSLPPISKPLIRTEIEEIDGRDGDIITKLGYSAYNKEVEIGLRGNFDVDDVIKYFDSDGIVTFSNEPDKYYHYQIIEQIDFERLVRYRTAKVTFHVQPFKYSTTEEQEDFTNLGNLHEVTVTNSGNIKSKPRITIYGSGTINLSLNGNQIFVIALGNEGQITIDSAQMEAYNGGILRNRLVTGDYDNFALNIGENTLSWTGSVSEIEIDNYSRWI